MFEPFFALTLSALLILSCSKASSVMKPGAKPASLESVDAFIDSEEEEEFESESDDATAPDSTESPSSPIKTTNNSGEGSAVAQDPNLKLTVTVSGRQLLVDGKPFTIKGVCYNPVRKGQSQSSGQIYINPSASDLLEIEKDFKMMQSAGVNTLRTYGVIQDAKVLSLLNKYRLFVIVPVLNYFGTSAAQVEATVRALKDHRSTLIWEVGNEWNYNSLYGASNFDAAKDLIKKTGVAIKNLDRSHPLSTDHGELPSAALIAELSDFDIWGLNIYSGKTFGDRFAQWKLRSTKPMYFGEFGADAINVATVDEASQAIATEALIKEIRSNLSAKSSDLTALGGTIFEWNDEWWKDSGGKVDIHDIGGIAPGGGPFPDSVFNEEWWGIVDIDRNPRPAYNKLKEQYLLP